MINFSVVIPAHNEGTCIAATLQALLAEFARSGIDDYEIVVVNDNSSDDTESVVREVMAAHDRVRLVNNSPPHGFGYAVRCGLNHFTGRAVCIVMADLSDSPTDVVAYYRLIQRGAECVFGSRFIKGSRIIDYPRLKLVVNRLANFFIRIVFRLPYNDVTNAFKCYRREVIEGIQPLISPHFNLTVEMPLKAIVRGFRYEVIPIGWTDRKSGESKLKLKEMGSRYLFIVVYVLMEKLLSRGDYRRTRS